MTVPSVERSDRRSADPPDFIELFLRSVGKTPDPLKLYEWACISMLGGLVQNRVTVTADPVKPPLPLKFMIILMSGSGAGKGNACNSIQQLIEDTFTDGVDGGGNKIWKGGTYQAQETNDRLYHGIHLVEGRMTRAALEDYLNEQCKASSKLGLTATHTYLYWIAEELSESFGQDKLAKDVVSILVSIFMEKVGDKVSGTRKDGFKLLKKPCVNMLGGSTWEWLPNVVSSKDAYGGFIRRVFFIDVPFDYAAPIERPSYEERDEVLMQQLYQRVATYASPSTAFAIPFTEAGEDAYYDWLNGGIPIPQEKGLLTFFGNRRGNMLKLAGMSALSRWAGDHARPPRIEPRDIVRGVAWWKEAYATMPKLMVETGSSDEARIVDDVAKILTRLTKGDKKTVEDAALMPVLVRQGYVKKEIMMALDTMMTAGWLQLDNPADPKARVWRWLGRH